jgi:tetratricopeptide (TPR) repeat protein
MSAGVFGRDAELRTLAAFLDGVPASPSALVLAGPGGAGKTTLLRAGAASAAERAYAVLRTAPARSDVRLAFAGLADLLEPCLPEVIDHLAPPQARALRVALLLEEAPPHPPEPRTIATAFRAALTALARSAPVLLVVDDVQWLDPASEAAVGFALRRLEHEPVGLLCAQRTAGPGADLPLELARARMPADLLPVGGLSLGALHRMLRTRLRASFSHPTLRRIEAGSDGNPFIALEIGRALVRRGGQPGQDAALPVPETLRELVDERLGSLAPEVIDALRLVAVMPDAPAATYLAAGVGVGGLDDAVLAGVLEPDGGRLRFTHPLLAAVVAGAIPPARKRELHGAAARVVQLPEERARHRALATAGRSAPVALELTAAARTAAARGAPAIAAELFELAASLTPDEDQARARRCRLEAARQLALSGDMTTATSSLERLVESMPPGPERSDVLTQLGLVREHDYPAATGLMERALAEAGDDPERTADIRIPLADIWSIRGDHTKAAAVARQGLADAERAADPALLAAALTQNFDMDVMYGPGPDERMLERALALEPPDSNLALRIPPAWAAGSYHICLGRLDDAEAEFRQLLARAEADGVEYFRAHVLRFLAMIAALRGDTRTGADTAAEGLDIAEQLDLPHTASMLLYVSAWVALQQGQADKVRELTGRGLKLAEQTGERMYVLLHQALTGSLYLALGDSAAAATQFRPLIGELHVIGLRPTVPSVAADAAEALTAAGEPEDARKILAQLERTMPSPVTAALLARCRGALAAAAGDLDTALAELADALRLHDQAAQMRPERGRTLLVLGGVQRRRKQRAAARATLTEALAIFDQVGAPLWAARTRAGLARISGRAPGPEDLTETERRVAELVARGMSNREVAAELFVTVRAVESTLTKTYAKLGLRSRTELARRLHGGLSGPILCGSPRSPRPC